MQLFFFALRPIPNLFVNKNAIKPHFPPKQGKNYGVGNVLGNFAHFAGNFEKYLLETLQTALRTRRNNLIRCQRWQVASGHRHRQRRDRDRES